MIHSVRFFIKNRLVSSFDKKFLKDTNKSTTLQALLEYIKNSVPSNIKGYKRIEEFDYLYMPQNAKLPSGDFDITVGKAGGPTPSHKLRCRSNTTISSLFSRVNRSGFNLNINKDEMILCVPLICKNWK